MTGAELVAGREVGSTEGAIYTSYQQRTTADICELDTDSHGVFPAELHWFTARARMGKCQAITDIYLLRDGFNKVMQRNGSYLGGLSLPPPTREVHSQVQR
jgi:hypothetical protein